MLALRNKTPYPAALISTLTKRGEELLVIAVKGTFSLKKGALEAAEEHVPLHFGDVHHGAPEKSSVKYPSDASPPKQGTDVLLVGSAYSPRRVTELDVGFSLGSLKKVLHITGERAWYRGVMSWAATKPVPFQAMPLVYERAFGGVDTTQKDAKLHGFEARNPVGTGFVASKLPERIEGLRLPDVEEPGRLVSSPFDKPAPAGMGWISASWQPRANLTGTYDAKWRAGRSPLLPEDFDEAFHNGASPGLVARPHLRGGEAVRIFRCSPHAETLGFNLPVVRFSIEALVKGETSTVKPVLDTVLLEPDFPRVVLTWRAALPVTRSLPLVELVTLAFAE